MRTESAEDLRAYPNTSCCHWHIACKLGIVFSRIARRCVDGRWISVKVSPDPRGLVGTDRSGDPDLQNQLQRWAPEASHAKRRGRHFVRVVHGLSVEGDPPQFGSGSALHRRFQEWAEAGVFHIFFAEMVHYYDDRVGVDLKWCSLDAPA